MDPGAELVTGTESRPTPDEPRGAQSEHRFSAPILTGRHIYLRPLAAEDHRSVRQMDLSAELGVRWRHRGATPGIAKWTQSNDSALAQFLVVRSSDHIAIGVTAVYNQSFQDQYAYFAAVSFAPAMRSPLMVMGSALMIDYTFKCWPFRKLYLELPEYNLEQLARGNGRIFVQEGRLGEHMYYDGRWWDKIILALYRRTWDERSSRLVAAALPAVRRSATISRPKR